MDVVAVVCVVAPPVTVVCVVAVACVVAFGSGQQHLVAIQHVSVSEEFGVYVSMLS